MDGYNGLLMLMRWLHIFVGIIWIGHLYFFNFVNVPLQGALDDAGKKMVNPHLMPRALWWFRWGAMLTFLSGLILFWMIYMDHQWGGGVFRDEMGNISTRAKWMMFGMGLGTIMWFNVWFIIWPAQQRLLGGTAGEMAAALRKRALLASRANTYLSGPMLFGMVNGSHAYLQGKMAVIVTAALGLLAIWASISASYKVGKSV